MTRYALVGANSKELLTFGGFVLTHDNCHELQFLLPHTRVVLLPRDIPEDQTLSIKLHPDLSWLHWPLVREDFIV